MQQRPAVDRISREAFAALPLNRPDQGHVLPYPCDLLPNAFHQIPIT